MERASGCNARDFGQLVRKTIVTFQFRNSHLPRQSGGLVIKVFGQYFYYIQIYILFYKDCPYQFTKTNKISIKSLQECL
jgi:hypothetical protein